MSIDFLGGKCQEPPTRALKFGICEDPSTKIAYTDEVHAGSWIATVQNDSALELTFTAVDKCLLQDDEYPGRGRCDGMLISDQHLYFIELKDEASGWITGAVDQLESTIQFFLESHDASCYKHKKAFACNRRHRHFQELDNELNLRFFRDYKFRIDAQATVMVVGPAG